MANIKSVYDVEIQVLRLERTWPLWRGEEGRPQQFLVRATFSSFSSCEPPRNPRPSIIMSFKVLILEDRTIF